MGLGATVCVVGGADARSTAGQAAKAGNTVSEAGGRKPSGA
jgi:hypothetical protein